MAIRHKARSRHSRAKAQTSQRMGADANPLRSIKQKQLAIPDFIRLRRAADVVMSCSLRGDPTELGGRERWSGVDHEQQTDL